MGMTWHSKAEILTTDNDRLSKISDWLESYSNNENKLHELNKGDCSILFSSRGYGSFGSSGNEDPHTGNLFQEICEEFDFPIICHERVLPCQSQGYGFWSVFGRWNDGIVRSYNEIVFDDTSSHLDLEETWADSAQIVCFPIDEIPDEDQIANYTLECIAWLISRKRLKMKIAIKKSFKGRFHPKCWLFGDGKNFAVLHGSSNATINGLTENTEQLSLSRDWTGGKDATEICEKLRRKFDDIWSLKDQGLHVFDLPEAVENNILMKFKSDAMPNEETYISLLFAWRIPSLPYPAY